MTVPEQKTIGYTLLIYSKTLPAIWRSASNEKHMLQTSEGSILESFSAPADGDHVVVSA